MPFRSLNDDFSFSLYEKASSVPANDWDTISKNDTIFLERDYLAIVETGQHTKLTSRYVIVYYKGKPCGIIYF